MLLKHGVSIENCRPEILIAYITIIFPLYYKYGHFAKITSGSEQYKHSADRSKHYSGDAIDLRHRFFSYDEKKEVYEKLKERLGPNFVVVLEKTHYHVHYAPTYEGLYNGDDENEEAKK